MLVIREMVKTTQIDTVVGRCDNIHLNYIHSRVNRLAYMENGFDREYVSLSMLRLRLRAMEIGNVQGALNHLYFY